MEIRSPEYDQPLAEWLRGLPKPIALLACNDTRAFQVLNICNTYHISVPEEVAVLGVDNDTVFCELSTPPLSSIDPNAAKIGYEAASLLHRMIQGCPPPDSPVLIPPLEVVSRRSTDVLAIPDPKITSAIQYIREHALEKLPIAKILRDLDISRGTLENWFSRYLGHSVTADILLIRIKRVQELLLSTDQSLETISHLCGFMHVESMFRAFKRLVKMSPGEYRRRERLSNTPTREAGRERQRRYVGSVNESPSPVQSAT